MGRKKKAAEKKASERERREYFFACAQLDWGATIAEALKKRPQLARARQADGDTALIVSAGFGNLRALRELIPASDLSARGAMGDTALIRAAGQGNLDALRLLIPGSDPSQLDNQRRSAFSQALAMNHWGCVEALLPVSDPRGRVKLYDSFMEAEDLALARGEARIAGLIQDRKRVLREREELAATLSETPRVGDDEATTRRRSPRM